MKRLILLTFYVIILTLGLFGLYSSFEVYSFEDYQASLTERYSVIDYLFSSLGVIALLLSITIIVLIYKKCFTLRYLVLPVYYVFYYLIWSFIIPLMVWGLYSSPTITLESIYTINRLNFVFYTLHILLSLYFFYDLYLIYHDNSNSKNKSRK